MSQASISITFSSDTTIAPSPERFDAAFDQINEIVGHRVDSDTPSFAATIQLNRHKLINVPDGVTMTSPASKAQADAAVKPSWRTLFRSFFHGRVVGYTGLRSDLPKYFVPCDRHSYPLDSEIGMMLDALPLAKKTILGISTFATPAGTITAPSIKGQFGSIVYYRGAGTPSKDIARGKYADHTHVEDPNGFNISNTVVAAINTTANDMEMRDLVTRIPAGSAVEAKGVIASFVVGHGQESPETYVGGIWAPRSAYQMPCIILIPDVDL